MIATLATLATLAANLFGLVCSASPRLFDTTWLEAGIHAGFPTGSLAGPFHPGPGYRLGVSTTYSGSVHAVGSLHYAPLDGRIPVHYLVAACGLDKFWSDRFSTAALLSLHYARSRDPDTPPLQLDGGESEFGIDLRASWAPATWLHPGMALRSVASIAFTRPEPSLWLWVGIDATWEWP